MCSTPAHAGFAAADEIDSILSERSAGEHEASRRLKTQFLVEFDGVANGSERIVLIGATNRPQELDDAVRCAAGHLFAVHVVLIALCLRTTSGLTCKRWSRAPACMLCTANTMAKGPGCGNRTCAHHVGAGDTEVLSCWLARRRLTKRIYIPLPDAETRAALISHLLKAQPVSLKPAELDRIVRSTEGYSGSDLAALCREAAMVPIRCATPSQLAA